MCQQLGTEEPTAVSPAGSQAAVAEPPGTGRQLDQARAADRAWRATRARKLYRRLGKLRQSSVLIQRLGIGVSGLMLLGAFVLPFWSHDTRSGLNRAMWLILGSLASAFGSLGAIAAIGWGHHALQNWMKRMGLAEEEELDTQTSGFTNQLVIEIDRSLVNGAGKVLSALLHLLLAGVLLMILRLILTTRTG